MAGRGVDIKLGKGVADLGGLFVIGTERHESRRIDNQLRGRSGRQGDPGASRFYISLEDDIMRIFGGEQVARVMNFLKMPEDTPIEHGMVGKAIEGAQKKVEGHNFDIRKTTVEYDDVMNQQRQIIYGVRKNILESSVDLKLSKLKQDILQKIDVEISNIVTANTAEGLDIKKIAEEYSSIINFDPASVEALEKQISQLPSAENITEFLIKLAHDLYEEKEKRVGGDLARQMEIFVYLNTIDTLWIEHLDTMDDLRTGIGLRSFGQREPLVEYKKEAFELFNKLIANIDFEIVHRIYKVAIQGQAPIQTPSPIQAVERHPEIEVGVETEKKEVLENKVEEGATTKVTVERGGQVISEDSYGSKGQLTKSHGKLGRNDPCWCGSGKKYKKCHYPN